MDTSTVQMIFSALAAVGGVATFIRLGRSLERQDEHERRITKVETVQDQQIAYSQATRERVIAVETRQQAA